MVFPSSGGGLVNGYQHQLADCQTAKSKDTRLQNTKLVEKLQIAVGRVCLAAWWPLVCIYTNVSGNVRGLRTLASRAYCQKHCAGALEATLVPLKHCAGALEAALGPLKHHAGALEATLKPLGVLENTAQVRSKPLWGL